MSNFFRTLFSSDNLSPHGICLTWRPELIWTHVVSDAVIGVAYFSIPIALAVFVTRRRDIAFGWIFWCFATFILACGTTHFMSIWTLWVPDYGLEGAVKLFTAGVSIVTAAALWPLLPKALDLPSPAELRRVNDDLGVRIAERDAAFVALRKADADTRRAEDLLRQAQKMDAIGQLTAGVAHDFNNLLTVVIGNVELLDRGIGGLDVSPATRNRLASIAKAAERGATLTSQLLAFSRRQLLEAKSTDLNAIVSRMRDLLQSSMGGSVLLDTRLGSDLWPALVDATQLELVILNLAINARDAMEVGGTLTVQTANVTVGPPAQAGDPPLGEHVMVAVTDTGSGMTPEVLAKAFEPFFTTKPVGRGSGLGLAQVYGFAKQSGGGVCIETTPGSGTTVKVFLPRSNAAEVPASAVAEPVPAGRIGGRTSRILLVDDDDAVREVTAMMLKDLGCIVIEAGSGACAVDILADGGPIDLVIVDYAMPGMNGVDVAHEARTRRPGLPILFITGFADQSALETVTEGEIVQKPFLNADLADKVTRLLRSAA